MKEESIKPKSQHIRYIAHRQCSICGAECSAAGLEYLPLYCVGSEGIEACLSCRLVLTEVAKGMQRVASAGRRSGYKSCRAVREAKEKQGAI